MLVHWETYLAIKLSWMPTLPALAGEEPATQQGGGFQPKTASCQSLCFSHNTTPHTASMMRTFPHSESMAKWCKNSSAMTTFWWCSHGPSALRSVSGAAWKKHPAVSTVEVQTRGHDQGMSRQQAPRGRSVVIGWVTAGGGYPRVHSDSACCANSDDLRNLSEPP